MEEIEVYNHSCLGKIEEGEYNSIKPRIINLNITVPPNLSKSLGCDIQAMIVANLLANGTVSYSRNKAVTTPDKYNKHKYSNYKVIRAIESSENEGLIENTITQYIHNIDIEDREMSYIKATPDLYSKFDKYNNKSTSKKNYIKDTQTVLLKDKEGKLMNYKDTYYTKELRYDLEQINDFMSKHEILNGSEKLSIVLRSHHKIDFNSYGRLFAIGDSHQNISKEKRLALKLNGNDVAEIDYSSLHVRMLLDKFLLNHYIDAHEDIYYRCLNDYNQWQIERNAVKLMVNIMINSKSKKKAIQAFNYKVMQDKIEIGSFKDASDIIHNLEYQLPFIFLDKNITDHIFNGSKPMAATFQYLEAQMCRIVLNRSKIAGIIVLPIHDSFVCEKENVEIVGKMMGDAYREIMFSDRIVPCSVLVGYNEWDRVF